MKNSPFDIPIMKQLRKTFEHENHKSNQKKNSPPKLEQTDDKLFLSAVADVKPLYSKQVEHQGLVKKIKCPINPLMKNETFVVDMMSDETQWLELDKTVGQVSYLKSNYEPQVLKKLKQGKFVLDNKIDLHGLTITTARDSLSAFLSRCSQRNQRYVLIIHGKGYNSKNGAVLKAKVVEWLEAHYSVIAFASAPVALGGTGAVVCKLKK